MTAPDTLTVEEVTATTASGPDPRPDDLRQLEAKAHDAAEQVNVILASIRSGETKYKQRDLDKARSDAEWAQLQYEGAYSKWAAEASEQHRKDVAALAKKSRRQGAKDLDGILKKMDEVSEAIQALDEVIDTANTNADKVKAKRGELWPHEVPLDQPGRLPGYFVNAGFFTDKWAAWGLICRAVADGLRNTDARHNHGEYQSFLRDISQKAARGGGGRNIRQIAERLNEKPSE